MAADHVTRVRTELESQRAELERVPFWARTRRTTATEAVNRAEGDLDRALARLDTEDTTLTRMTVVVDNDTTQRGLDEERARRRRHTTWAAWGTTVMDDPNPHTGKDDPRLQPVEPAWVPEPFTVDHDPPHRTPSYDSGHDYGYELDRGYGIDR